MRILQVTLGFYPAQAWGGPVKVVYQNSKELVNRGHEVTVYCTNLLNKKQKIRPHTFEQNIDGIRVVYMDTMNLHWWPGTLGPFWLPELASYLEREIFTFDVVHLNGYRSPLMLTPARAAQSAHLPIVTQLHGSMQLSVNTFLKRGYDRLWGKMELQGISCLLALQASERQQALDYGVPPERIEVLPNGIDPAERENVPPKGSFRKRLGIDPDQSLILFLGRINKTKGADMLVEAFARLNDPNARLVIAGPDDGQLDEVRRLIAHYRLGGRVFLPGLLCGPDVLSAFQDANLFVLPCRADTFPVTILEACLMDIPMVVTNGCSISHLIRGLVAEVVPFEAQAFADGMKRLLTDRERYKLYKSNCQTLVSSTFSIQAVVDQLEAVYQRVIAEKENGEYATKNSMVSGKAK